MLNQDCRNIRRQPGGMALERPAPLIQFTRQSVPATSTRVNPVTRHAICAVISPKWGMVLF